MDEAIKEQLKGELALALKDLQATAIDNCYSRYDIWAQLIGVSVAVAGGGLLSVLMPGGVIASATLAALIMGATTKMVADDADRIEQGDIGTLQRYCSDDAIKVAISPIAAKVESAKKLPAQGTTPTKSGTTTPSNGSPSPEPCRSLPLKPVTLAPESHLLAWGRTRGGKTNTVQHLLKDAQRVHYVSTKAKDQVPTHWHGYRLDPRHAEQQLAWLMDAWEATFYSHLDGSTQGDTWFLFDEVISLMALASDAMVKRMRAFITQVLTSGAGVGAYVGLLTQSENAGELKISLDLLKNCTIVACSVKACDRDSMVQAFAKYAGLAIDTQQRAYIKTLTGYWQLWDNEGACLSQITQVNCQTKPLELCPASEPPSTADAPQSMTARVATYLKRQKRPQKVRDIRSNIKRSDDDSSTLTQAVKDALTYLVGDGLVMEEPSGQTTVYWWITEGEGEGEGRSKRLRARHPQLTLSQNSTPTPTHIQQKNRTGFLSTPH